MQSDIVSTSCEVLGDGTTDPFRTASGYPNDRLAGFLGYPEGLVSSFFIRHNLAQWTWGFRPQYIGRVKTRPKMVNFRLIFFVSPAARLRQDRGDSLQKPPFSIRYNQQIK